MGETRDTLAREQFDTLLIHERPRLVRLCARLSGSREAAEDLAQDTLVEAWRQHQRLTDWNGVSAWLAAIAQFVCLRWQRRQGREWRYRVHQPNAAHQKDAHRPDLSGDLCDVDHALDQQTLALLLDRALALLPADTRAVLIQKYIDDLPLAELAARAGVSEGAAAMRLQRSKRLLQQVLRTHLQDDAVACGLLAPDTGSWQSMRLWCPFCGTERLAWHHDPHTGQAIFRCAQCATRGHADQLASTIGHVSVRRMRGAKTVLAQTLTQLHHVYRDALRTRSAACWGCGRPTPVGLRLGEAGRYGLTIRCDVCRRADLSDLHYLVLDHPHTQRFWQTHERIRMGPPQSITFRGHVALVTTVEQVAGTATLAFISAADTLDVLAIDEPLPSPAYAAHDLAHAGDGQ